MKITLYKFTKKINSTLRPSNNTPKLELEGNIKQPSSIINPSIQITKAKEPIGYNYAYIPEFNRYYFISDMTYNIGTWLLDLRVDVLASFRADILNSEQYILRSYSDYDGNILDNLYTTKATTSYAETTANTIVVDPDMSISYNNYFNDDFTTGIFVIGVISSNATGVTYYGFTYENFKKFIYILMDYAPNDIDDVSLGIAKSLYDPMQYITTCRWYPVDLHTGITPVVRAVRVGSYYLSGSGDNDFTCFRFNNQRKKHLRTSITIPKHTQVSDYPYLQLAPYSEYSLIFEPFGTIPLDTTKIYGATALNLDWYIDNATGDAELFISRSDTGAIITTNVSNIGVDIQLAQLTVDYIGQAGGVIGAVSSFLGGVVTGQVGSAINGAISGIGNAISSSIPQLSSKGAAGSFLSYIVGAPKLLAYFYILVDTNPELYGRPLCQNETLSSLRGYCLCSNANLTFSDNLPIEYEASEIVSLLNSGIFIEV